MEQKAKNIYYASLIEDVEFSDSELSRMDIAFIDNLNELEEGLSKLNVELDESSDKLVDYGYALTQVGSIEDPSWAIHSIELNVEYVLDVWERRNFYIIYRQTEGEPKVVFRKAYLREHSLEEDITYYIELDLKYREGPHEVFTDYIQ